MSQSAEQPDPEVVTLDHLFQGVPDPAAPPVLDASTPAVDPPEDVGPTLTAAP